MRTDRLRDTREQKGLTQRELAQFCGLGEQQIHRYESGKSEPTATHLSIVADKLEVSVDYLLGRTDDPGQHVGGTELSDEERTIVSAFRQKGWSGLIHLIADRVAERIR